VQRAIAVLSLALVAAVPASARAGGLDLRLGAFFPSGNSNLFDDDSQLYLHNGHPVTKSDFNGIYGGLEYNARLARNVEIGFSVDGYGRSLDTSYRDFVSPNGDEIRQTLKLNIVPVGVSIRIVPTNRRAAVAPYIAVGADLVFWNYEEFGDFVDFSAPAPQPIVPDHFKSSGVAPGAHVAVGVRIALARDFSLVGEGRYLWAKADMGGDFAPTQPGLGNRIDLGGASATLGFHLRF
jgi:Outer membrane protein beta-barrel domain